MEWNEERDLIMAEKMLQGIREGKSKAEIYKELSDKFSCETTECRNRWEKHLESKYKMAMQLAEKFYTMTVIRKKPSEFIAKETLSAVELDEKKPIPVVKSPKKKKRKETEMVKEIRIADIIAYLQTIEESETELKENESIKEENKKLKEKIEMMESEYQKIVHEYQAVMSIVKRANRILEVG